MASTLTTEPRELVRRLATKTEEEELLREREEEDYQRSAHSPPGAEEMAAQRQPPPSQPNIKPNPLLMAERTRLECLAPVTQVSIDKQGAAMCEAPSFFTVRCSTNPNLFSLQKESVSLLCLVLPFGPANQPFDMLMSQQDAGGKPSQVMVFRRPLRLQSGLKGCFCGCLGQEMKIETPAGTTVASISEDNTRWRTSLTIRDARKQPILKVSGPALPPYCSCMKSPAVFKVKSMAGSPLGEIRTDGYNFVDVSFPTDLDVLLKGSLIGCGILVRHMFDPDGCIVHSSAGVLIGFLLCIGCIWKFRGFGGIPTSPLGGRRPWP
ncbi:phospholipid scramblase 3-like [Ornithodoros turicata]|uniref:phospholipid scramblase 3-like n=1 Tax=Ornithodoros turicata TaxID=34597 RepID=UPI003139A98F